STYNEISGVAHYRVKNDQEAIAKIREFVGELPRKESGVGSRESGTNQSSLKSGVSKARSKRSADDIYTILPEDHRQPYDMRALLDCILDDGHLDEFQADYAKEIITGHASINGIKVGLIANARGMFRDPRSGPPKFGGIIYTESAEKVAYFIDTCNRHGTPLLFIQDFSGFMVGSHAERSGVIRSCAC